MKRGLGTVLVCFTVLLADALAADPLPLSPDRLDYYLVQAFHSPDHSSRFALNHIGIQVRQETGGYRVLAVLEGFPAHEAGLLRGDLIETAGDDVFHPVFSFNDRQRAPGDFLPDPGPVNLTLMRNAQQLEIAVTPVFGNLYDAWRSATLASIREFPSGNKLIGYVRLWSLSRNSADLITFRRVIDALQHSDGLILDLRSSYGFLDKNHLRAIYRGADDLFEAPAQPGLVSEPGPYFPLHSVYRKPVALLIDAQTRGGAELMTYQLDRLARVVSIGEQTAGEPLPWLPSRDNGQLLFSYPDSGLGLDGEVFQGHPPELTVDFPATQQGRIDPHFQTAMDFLMGRI